jgi:chorismate-pyruvate lyase
MPESSPTPAVPTALPYAYPLDDLYARAGRPLPPIERITGDEIPEPYRSLLVHESDMTPTLEKFHGARIHLRILNREQRGDFYFREVALLLNGSEKPVEFGANKVSMVLFPPRARQLILDERLPLGRILRDCELGHTTTAKAFFRVTADDLITGVFGLKKPMSLFGRKATIYDLQKRPLSEIVEILPPEALAPK